MAKKSYNVIERFKLFCLVVFALLLSVVPARGQAKLNISFTLPSKMDVCGAAAYCEVELRNISTGSITNLSAALGFPAGLYYVKGSVSGSGISELNVSDSLNPVFSLPNLSIAQAARIRIQLRANCQISNLLNSGKLVTMNATGSHSGGSVQASSSPFSIDQPALQIKSVSNRFYQSDLYEIFVREIVLVNSGKGRLSEFRFRQINQKGLQLLGVSGGKVTVSRDTATSYFDASHISQTGNKDNWLDQNEEVVIRDTLRTLSCLNLGSVFSSWWGCDGQICQSTNSSGNVTIQTKVPSLLITPSSTLSPCLEGSNTFSESLRIVNTGDDTARFVIIDVFQTASTGHYTYMLSKILENSFSYRIGKLGQSVSLTPSRTVETYSTGNYSCLGKNPVGLASLSLPEIKPGDTLFLEWQSASCCPPGCNFAFYVDRWNYSGSYFDRCGNAIPIVEKRGGNGYYSRITLSSFGPSDAVRDDTVLLNYELDNVSLIPQTSRGRFEFDFVRPKGLEHSLSTQDFYLIDIYGRTWKPALFQERGDTIRAVFYGYTPITLNRSLLKVRVRVACSQLSGNGKNLSYQMLIRYISDSTCSKYCKYLMACTNDKISLHCGSNCNGGLQFSDFDVHRTSFGQPDNNNDGVPDARGSLDFDKIKRELVMYGDTLLCTFKGKFKDLGSTSSWRFLYASTYMPYGTYLDVSEVRIRIFRNNSLLYDCNGLKATFTNSGVHRTFYIDAGVPALISAKCPLYSGFNFTRRDSVELMVKYHVSKNPGNFESNIDLINSFYTSTSANPPVSQRLQCDTFAGKFRLLGYYFTNYGTNIFSSNSCAPVLVTQNYYLSVGSCCENYAGGNIFPFEYRSWAKLDELTLHVPNGFKAIHADLREYRTKGTGFTENLFLDTIKPYRISGDSIRYRIADRYKDQNGTIPLSDDGFYGVFRAWLQPTCNLGSSTKWIRYDFKFRQLNYLGNGTEIIPSGTQDDQLQYDAPIVSLAVAQNQVLAKSDTVEWEVRFNNTSGTSSASNLWISSTPSSNVTLVEVFDPISQQKFLADSGVFRLGSLPKSGFRDLRVRAIFKSCEPDSIEILAGYNCDAYPSSFQNLYCSAFQRVLSYIPQNTRLDSDILDSNTVANLCDDRWYRVRISNTGEARVFGLYLDLTLRDGMIAGDTAWVFYPSGNDSFPITNPVPQSGGRLRWNIYQGSSNLITYGLAGINGVNSLILKFKLSTDCNFIASSFFLSRPGGTLKCGNPVLSAYTVGKPIEIFGVKKPYYSSILMKLNPLDVCNFQDSAEIKFINLGPDTTGITDRIQLILPSGISIDTKSTTWLHGKAEKTIFLPYKGGYKVEWIVGKGLLPGDSLHFRARIRLDILQIDCGMADILIQPLVLQPAICMKTNSWCNINVATSSQQLIDSVRKGDYTLLFKDAKGQPNGSVEQITLNYGVRNRGTGKIQGELLTIHVVEDVNENGLFEVGEPVLHTDSILTALANQATISRTLSFFTSGVQSCRLLLVLDSGNCACTFRNLKIPPVSIENAGRDTTVCSGEQVTLGLGPVTGIAYRWNFNPGLAQPDSSSSLFTWEHNGRGDSILYLVLKSSKGSCISYDTVAVTVRPAIIVNLKDTIPVCSGSSAFIGQTARGGSGTLSYSWTPTTDLSSPTVSRTWANPPVSRVYTVRITDPKGCEKKDSSLVQVLQLPQIAIDVKDTCADSLVQFFNVSTSYNGSFYAFFWEIGPSIVTEDENPVISLPNPGTYLVRFNVTDSMGCSASTSDSVEIYPNPVTSIQLTDACAGDSLTFRADTSTGLSHAWYFKGVRYPGAYHRMAFSADTALPIALLSTNSFACSALSRDTIRIFGAPTARISTADVCLGDSSKLFALAIPGTGDSVRIGRWATPAGTFTDTGSISLLLNDTGLYQVSFAVLTLNGCRDTASVQFRVHELPVLNLLGPDVCLGDSIVLAQQSSLNRGIINRIEWDAGNGFSPGSDTLRIFAPASGFQRLRAVVHSDAGCTDTAVKQVYVHGISSVAPGIQGNCEGETYQFIANPSEPDSVDLIRWFFTGGDSVTGLTANKWFTSSGNMGVRLNIRMRSGCEKDTSFTVDVHPRPIADLDISLPCKDDLVRAVNRSETPSGTIKSVDWFANGTFSGSFDTLLFRATNPGTVQQVTLIVENSYGCTDTLSTQIDAGFAATPGFEVLNACEGQAVRINNTSSAGSDPQLQFLYDMGDGFTVRATDSFQYIYRKPGLYTIQQTITNSAGCAVELEKQAEVYPKPTAAFRISPDQTNILNSVVSVYDESSGADSIRYELSNGAIFLKPDFEVAFEDSGTYLIRQWVYNRFQCSDSFSRSVRVNFRIAIWVPNAFSPNEDQLNALFRPYGDGMVSYDLRVYSRWGEEVFRSSAESQAWDGKNAIPGVYMYRLEVTDYEGKPHYFEGIVHVLR